MNEFFFSALSFGLAAGLKPGPLGMVVIQQTLSRGLPSGVRASLAPLVTDGPIIMAALWLLSQCKSINLFAAALSLVGGLYVLWLSRKMFRVQNISISSNLGSKSECMRFVHSRGDFDSLLRRHSLDRRGHRGCLV